jgi:hypothetical protein
MPISFYSYKHWIIDELSKFIYNSPLKTDSTALFVESLCYGFGHYKKRTTLPAPLFFERVVRDYISEFSITDDMDNEKLEIEENQTDEGESLQLSLF